MNTTETERRILSRPKSKTNWIYEQFFLVNPKNGELLKCDAAIEHDFILSCFFDPNIIFIKTDLKSVKVDCQDTRYTGDILIGYVNKWLENIECKSAREMLSPNKKIKFKNLSKEYENNKGALRVVTDEEIRKGYLITNYKRLYTFLNYPTPSSQIIDLVCGIVKARVNITFAELLTQIKKYQLCNREIWYCLAHNHLKTNLEKYITPSSVIWSE